MTRSSPQFEELTDLVWSLVNDRLDAGGAVRLQALLEADAANRRVYLELMDQFALLEWEKGEGPEIGDAGFGARGSGLGIRELPISASHEPLSRPSISPSSALPPLTTSHYPLAGNFVGGPVFSYMVATVILGVMLLGAWAYTITRERQAVDNTKPSATSGYGPELVFVGRVTGMKDCRWADPSTQTYIGSSVPLDRKYALSAGLMEITYDTGAKVILEGPCTYQVESGAGGYLKLGKLTARIVSTGLAASAASGKRSEARGRNSRPKTQELRPQSEISKFSVRTPTAIVTDLGTEFGVEVNENGNTMSYVFRGAVKIRQVGTISNSGQTILHAQQAARCTKNTGIVVKSDPAGANRFIRQLGLDLSKAERIVERFDGVDLGPGFEQIPPGRYRIEHGLAAYRHEEPPEREWVQSRGYIRTVEADFCRRDFIFEATFQVELHPSDDSTSIRHQVFFGIGDGVPNAKYFDEIRCGLVLAFVVDNGRAQVEICLPGSDSSLSFPDDKTNKYISAVAPYGSLKPGRHSFRMWKNGRLVKFAVDADFQGEFHADFVSRPIDLATVAPLLNSTNSRLLVGTGNCDSMTVRFRGIVG